MSDLRYWLWLANLPGMSAYMAMRYLRAFPSIKSLYLAGEAELRQIPGAKSGEVKLLCQKEIFKAELIEDTCRRTGIQVLCMQDAAYPDRLRNIDDPPLVIYVKGELPPVDDRLTIAVVGTRKCGEYGRETARRIGSELAAHGAVIVTGLADGIDAAAAEGALRNGGSVIGVLGCGADIVYPAKNRELFAAVERCGALVSEFPPGTPAVGWHFPVRNRIISGLSLGVTVVEAPMKSGSLITASRAQEQGRDVFVVPGTVNDPNFQGSNALIRDGAQLIFGGTDILEEYRFRYPELLREYRPSQQPVRGNATDCALDKRESEDYSSLEEQLESLTEPELKLVGTLAEGVFYPDELLRRSGLSASDGMAALTMLEIKGYVKEENGQYRLLIHKEGTAGLRG